MFENLDAVVITNLSKPQTVYNALVANVPSERIYVPAILGIKNQASADFWGK